MFSRSRIFELGSRCLVSFGFHHWPPCFCILALQAVCRVALIIPFSAGSKAPNRNLLKCTFAIQWFVIQL